MSLFQNFVFLFLTLVLLGIFKFSPVFAETFLPDILAELQFYLCVDPCGLLALKIKWIPTCFFHPHGFYLQSALDYSHNANQKHRHLIGSL